MRGLIALAVIIGTLAFIAARTQKYTCLRQRRTKNEKSFKNHRRIWLCRYRF